MLLRSRSVLPPPLGRVPWILRSGVYDPLWLCRHEIVSLQPAFIRLGHFVDTAKLWVLNLT